MNPYLEFVAKIEADLRVAKNIPTGTAIAKPLKRPGADAPVGLIFSPHPDDECINGGLALRLLREAGYRIINVPVTLGSDPGRRDARQTELTGACRYLGFEVEFLSSGGFEDINPESWESGGPDWHSAVAAIAELIERMRPRVLFYPHRNDRHPVHCGTNLLVNDALRRMPPDFSCLTVESEYWQAIEQPNLMVELDVETVADLVAAVSIHHGEVRRNPYHVSLPAWMIDNVRRGSELVGTAGGSAVDFVFAVLHTVSVFRGGQSRPAFNCGQFLSAEIELSVALETWDKQIQYSMT